MFPTGTVTFLFTDIEGSTPLWEREPQAMRAALQKHNAILNAAISENGGVVFKFIGDAFQVAFDEPAGAVRAALDAQQNLAAAPWDRTSPLRVRMGIHSGPAEYHEDDYAASHTLNRVARIMSAGYGGQILLSLAAAELVREQLPEGARLIDLGEYALKGMSRPERIFQLVAPGLPQDFPPLAAQAYHPHNLPPQLTGFIGRDKEIEQLRHRLAASRLVTLTGPGGVGKSRLSLQAAETMLDEVPDGVWLVELAPITNPGLVVQAVARIFNVRQDPDRTLEEALFDYLHLRRLLLLLDNCEHLIEASAGLAEALLRACPHLRILASSREPLGVEGEAVLRVPSLSLPESGSPGRREGHPPLEDLARSEAVRLFIDRVQASRPEFQATEENAADIVQICRRLDGIPLAIELAAARARLLGVSQIAARLDDAFRLLTGGSRTALPRQQTLRAAIDWSYNLLSEPERTLFRRLAVFAGGWTLEAAEAICKDGAPGAALHPSEILDLLSQLADKSLVGVDQPAGREARYRLLETVRQYAREKLAESGEADILRWRHHDWFVAWVEAGLPRQKNGAMLSWMDALEGDFDNLRAARDWAVDSGSGQETSLRLASGLYRYWWVRGNLGEGLDWLKHGLEADPGQPHLALHRARALYAIAWVGGALGYHKEGLEWVKESVAACRALGEAGKAGLVEATGQCALTMSAMGEREAAFRLVEEGEAIGRTLVGADRWSLAMLLWSKATMLIFAAHPSPDGELARRLAEESWMIFRQLGDRWNAGPLLILGEVDRGQNRYASGRQHFEAALAHYEELRDQGGMAAAYDGLTRLAILQGDYKRAAHYFREGIWIRMAQGNAQLAAQYLEIAAFFWVHNLLENPKKDPGRSLAWVVRLLGAASVFGSSNRLIPRDRNMFIHWWLRLMEEARDSLGIPLKADERQAYLDGLARLETHMKAETYDQWLAEGQAMNLDQAIERATEFGEL